MRSPDFTHETAVARRPHYVAPNLASVRAVFLINRSGPGAGSGGAGLGVTTLATVKVLNQAGLHAEAWDITSAGQLFDRIEREELQSNRPITHIIINTPNVIMPRQIGELASRYPAIEFIQLNHTGLAYMSIDDHGPQRIREVLDLQLKMPNVKCAGNNARFNWFGVYGVRPIILPNLYDTEHYVQPVAQRADFDPLRVGTFGENRPWKNFAIAAEAALSMAQRRRVRLELYVNSDRWAQTWGYSRARQELFDGLTWAKVIEVPWQDWAGFRHLINGMDICLNPSFDETFCSVVADAIAEGVPCVTSGCIEWSPRSWQAPETYDPASVMATGMALLVSSVTAVHDGRQALSSYVTAGTKTWVEYLVS